MIILGIDPGTAIMGFGVIEKTGLDNQKNYLKCVDFGCITTSASFSDGKRLYILQQELEKLIKNHRPDILTVEDIFFFKNLKTAVKVAQAKGIVIFTAAKLNIPILEYKPLQIKQTISSYGRAQKSQMQKMVQYILKLKETPKPDDAADALACAICFAYSNKSSLFSKKTNKGA